MGLGFLTFGNSIEVVRFPGCPTLSDWCVVRSKDGNVQCFYERMSWLVQRRFWSEEKGLSPGPEAWLSRIGSQGQRHWGIRPTQSIMYVPLQVNRSQKIILLIVQYNI